MTPTTLSQEPCVKETCETSRKPCLPSGQGTPAVPGPAGGQAPQNSSDLAALRRRSQDALKAGDIATAISILREALAVYPAHSESWNDLGALLGQSGQAAQAEVCFQQAFLADRQNFAALANLLEATTRLKKYDQAAALVEQWARLRPKCAKPWLFWAKLHLLRGNTAGAISALDVARKVAPDNPEIQKAFDSLGTAQTQSGSKSDDLARRIEAVEKRLSPEYINSALRTFAEQLAGVEAHGSETSGCRARLAPFCTGYGLDLGFGGDAITTHAIRMDMPRPYTHVGEMPVQLGGDARSLYWFRDGVLDFVYSSHLLEDFTDTESVLREWLRVIKAGGRLILYCPDEQAFRRRCAATGQPYNPGHQQPDFSLSFVKAILERIGGTKLIHETPLTNAYSWELVVQKAS